MIWFSSPWPPPSPCWTPLAHFSLQDSVINGVLIRLVVGRVWQKLFRRYTFGKQGEKNKEQKVLPDTTRRHTISLFGITQLYWVSVAPSKVRRESASILDASYALHARKAVCWLTAAPHVPFKFSVMSILVILAVIVVKLGPVWNMKKLITFQ